MKIVPGRDTDESLRFGRGTETKYLSHHKLKTHNLCQSSCIEVQDRRSEEDVRTCLETRMTFGCEVSVCFYYMGDLGRWYSSSSYTGSKVSELLH